MGCGFNPYKSVISGVFDIFEVRRPQMAGLEAMVHGTGTEQTLASRDGRATDCFMVIKVIFRGFSQNYEG